MSAAQNQAEPRRAAETLARPRRAVTNLPVEVINELRIMSDERGESVAALIRHFFMIGWATRNQAREIAIDVAAPRRAIRLPAGGDFPPRVHLHDIAEGRRGY